jgi:hypothetical protein
VPTRVPEVATLHARVLRSVGPGQSQPLGHSLHEQPQHDRDRDREDHNTKAPSHHCSAGRTAGIATT